MNKVRYLNKNNNANERENYSKWWYEQINHYGTRVDYYTNSFGVSGTQDYLYGEDPTSVYVKTGNVIMITDITNDALMLSKFGIMADCDMTAVIHISAFYDEFGPGAEPKAGDLVRLTEYGADRPGLRSAPVYEISERDDEYLPLTNPLIGHYVWYIKCKRFEYSFEPGVEQSVANVQLNDVGEYGRLDGGANPEQLTQPYEQKVQTDMLNIYNNPTTEGLVELIQSANQDTSSGTTLASFIPSIPPLSGAVQPVKRTAYSAYDYYDKSL